MKPTPKKGGQRTGKRRYGDGRAAFLGHLEALRKWVEEGRTLKAFFDEHEAALGISYPQFTRHARTYIDNPKPTRRQTNGNPQTPAAVPSRPAPQAGAGLRSGSTPARPAAPGVAPQFRHQAEAGDKDDLV